MSIKPTTTRSLTHSTISGAAWLLFQAVGSRGVGLASQVVLARILAPADFGVLSLALTVTTLVGLITNFGADDVLLQRQRTIRYWTTPALIMSLALGTIAFVGVCVATPIAAHLYRAPELQTILPVMALAMPIGAVSVVSAVVLRARLDFKVLAKINVAEVIVTQTLTIAFALLGFGPLSFALPVPIAAAMRSIAMWVIAKPRFRKPRSGQYGRMFTQGGMVFASRMLIACVNQGASVILGILTTPVIVGIYYFASRLAVQPVQLLAGNFSTVLFPAMAQLRSAPERQRDAALNASRILAAIVMPYCFLQASVAEPVVDLAFGAKWVASVPLIQILSIGLAFDAVSWIAGSLLSARGEFARALKYSAIYSICFFAAIAVGAYLGAELGVALAVSAYYVLLQPIYSYLVYRSYGVTMMEVFRIYFGPALAAALGMGIAVLVVRRFLGQSGPIVHLLTISVVGLCLYTLILRLLAPALVLDIVARVRGLRKKLPGEPVALR